MSTEIKALWPKNNQPQHSVRIVMPEIANVLGRLVVSMVSETHDSVRVHFREDGAWEIASASTRTAALLVIDGGNIELHECSCCDCFDNTQGPVNACE